MAVKSLPPFQCITNGSMTGTSTLSSTVTDIKNTDNVGFQCVWTGTPTGTFSVLCSNDYNPTTQAGDWTAVTLSPSPAASGAAGSVLIDLNQLSFAFVQLQYTNASSTGTLQAWVSGKGL